MKNILDLNWKSRTVWVGIIGFVTSVFFGIYGFYNPAVQLSAPVDTMAQAGLLSLLGIFIKS